MVWDKEENKILCKFIEGQYETEDIDIIEKLKSRNYTFDKKEVNDADESKKDESTEREVKENTILKSKKAGESDEFTKDN